MPSLGWTRLFVRALTPLLAIGAIIYWIGLLLPFLIIPAIIWIAVAVGRALPGGVTTDEPPAPPQPTREDPYDVEARWRRMGL
jgi:hypothetical protein